MLSDEEAEKTILVTGGNGLLGSAIKQVVEEGLKLPNENWIFTTSQECDLREFDATKALFDKYTPTHVIHTAAIVKGLFSNMQQNLEFFLMNMRINTNVLRCCHEANVVKCISCLSTCILPDKTTYPIDETMLHNGPPHESNYGYSYAKRMIEVLSRGYRSQYGRSYITVMPCNIFGPHDNFSLECGHVLPALMHKCYLAKQNNTPLTIFGSGKPLRQFIYSLDLAKLFVWTLRNYDDIEPIILATDEKDEVAICDAVNAVIKSMDFKGKFSYDTTMADGQFKKTASNRKLRSYLPNFEFTPFDKAIQKTCDWFVANYETARK